MLYLSIFQGNKIRKTGNCRPFLFTIIYIQEDTQNNHNTQDIHTVHKPQFLENIYLNSKEV